MNFSKVAVLFAFLYIVTVGFSQNVIGPRALSLGGNSTILQDAYSVTNNMGLISEINEIQIATSYSVPYLISEFQQQGLVGVVPLKKGGISLGGQFTGKDLFRQQKISLGYGLKLNDKLSIGIGLNHQQLRIQNYGTYNVITSDIGMFAKINEKVSLGVSVLSFGGNHSNINQERFPTTMQLGISYSFQKQLQTYFTIDKSSISNVNYRIGLEYEAFKNLWFRTGSVLNSKTLAFGIGYELPLKLRVDVGSQWQQTLGWTPHVGFLYRFSTKK
jgi:hypothetical protein